MQFDARISAQVSGDTQKSLIVGW